VRDGSSLVATVKDPAGSDTVLPRAEPMAPTWRRSRKTEVVRESRLKLDEDGAPAPSDGDGRVEFRVGP